MRAHARVQIRSRLSSETRQTDHRRGADKQTANVAAKGGAESVAKKSRMRVASFSEESPRMRIHLVLGLFAWFDCDEPAVGGARNERFRWLGRSPIGRGKKTPLSSGSSGIAFSEASLDLHRPSLFSRCWMSIAVDAPSGTAIGEGSAVPPFAMTHRNHFKFGYDNRWFEDRRSPEDKWAVAYGRCERPVKDWRAECIETAKVIRASTDLDLWVMFSGGIDSEVVLQSFLFADIPVNAAITCFRNNLNRQDVRYAVKFCETHGVPYKLLHIDIEEFFESGDALRMADRTHCVHPVLLHTMWAMNQVNGYPILGSAECYLVKRSADKDVLEPAVGSAADEWVMHEKERIASWYRHLLVERRPGCAGFFQYTPEIMLAFLQDPIMVELCNGRLPDHTDTMKVKAHIYRRHFLLERRVKYTGFENVEHLDAALRPVIEQRHGAYNQIVRTPYADLVASLTYGLGA
jgi:hypothetical protein